MLLRSIGAALLSMGAAHGFKNSSPFFMLSTEPSNGGIESALVNTAEKVSSGLLKAVGDCSQSQYTVISQPGLTVADLHSEESKSTGRLSGSEKYQQRVKIENVLSEVDAEKLAGRIASRCGAADQGSKNMGNYASKQGFTGAGKEVSFVRFEPLPEQDAARSKKLALLHRYLDETFSPEDAQDHMVIVLSTPSESFSHPEHLYEMDEPYPSAMHQDLKRDIEYSPLKSSNSSMQDGLPLFEKYQFLSPGIFMGLTVSLFLIVILYVGVSAIAGLEVSYMAFSKEMGPAAQSKGKQQ